MVGIMLMVENVREGQILKMAFEQLHVKVIVSEPSYANYVKTLQYMPDIIIIEIPRKNIEQLQYVKLLRKSKKTEKLPVISYGNAIDQGIKNSLVRSGINNYLVRPLKFSQMMPLIKKFLKAVDKSIDDFPKKNVEEKDEDIKLILDNATLPVKKIELIVNHISGLMAFPFTVAKVLKLADSDKSGAKDLAKVIEADLVISASILKVSNTVFFASASRRISTIKDAIVRIGFTETKRIVMAMTVMDALGGEDNSFGFSRLKFWKHSLSTAIIAEKVAKRIGGCSSDEVFLAALLHDFGIILLDEFFPTIFEKVLEVTTNSAGRFINAERELMVITHNDVVKELFNSWKLPSSISESASLHYDILKTEKKIVEINDKVALSVEVGNILSKVYNNGLSGDMYITPIENWVFGTMKMPAGITKGFKEDIDRELQMYMKFLNIKEDSEKLGDFAKKVAVWSPVVKPFMLVKEYLESLGHEVTVIKKSEDYTEFNGEFDLICAETIADTTLEELTPLAAIIQHAEEDSSENKIVPVLAFVNKGFTLDGSEATEKISFSYYEGDLRSIEKSIARILEGEIVELESNSVETADNSTNKSAVNVSDEENQGQAEDITEAEESDATPA